MTFRAGQPNLDILTATRSNKHYRRGFCTMHRFATKLAASKAKDADKLAAILADSCWVGLEWNGKITSKAKALADMKLPGNSLDTIEMSPMTVRTFGNTAVVTGSDTEKSS